MKKILITFFVALIFVSIAHSQNSDPDVQALYNQYIDAMKTRNVDKMISYMYTTDASAEDIKAIKDQINQIFNNEKMTYSFIQSEIKEVSNIIEKDKIKYGYLHFTHKYSLTGKNGDDLVKGMYDAVTGGIENENIKYDEASSKLTIKENSVTYLIKENGKDWKLVDNLTVLSLFPDIVYEKLMEVK